MTTAKAEKEHNEEQQSSTSESTVASMAPEQNTSPSPNDISSKHHVPVKISLRHRLKHFTFAWFLCTMSTGGLSIALAETPHKFRGLHTIGLIVFFLNLVLFSTFTGLMVMRILLYPQHVQRALTHPSESLFLGSFLLSISVIIGGIQVYSITYGPSYPWLVDAVYILYWVYAGFSFANCVAQYWLLISRSIVRPVPFTPSMFLAGYSAMLTGTIASLIAPHQPPSRNILIIYSGVAFQGYGWLISLVCIAFSIRGLLDTGFPPAPLRPALFIPVGSVAYTIVALINLANAIPEGYGYFAKRTQAKEILQVLSLFMSIFMWLFAFWLFCLALVANVSAMKGMPFKLSWWAFIFPNVGFMLSTSVIGSELESPAILWIASALTVGLVGIWLVAAVGCVRAVWKGRIVWPGRDEDKDL